jgi:hypothetical protein
VSARTLQVDLWELHPNQNRVRVEAARYNVVNCGRRFGKTILGEDLAEETAIAGYPVGWFAPEYKLLTEAWRSMLNTLDPIIKRADVQQKRIELITGGVIECWAFDRNPRAGRSRKYKRVVIDEAAHADNLEEAFTRAIQPTLTDFKGDAWFLSSPNGQDNFFYKLYRYGIEGKSDWRSWTFTSYDNPNIDPAELDNTRSITDDWVFEQEYLAKFHAESVGRLIPDAWIDRCHSVQRAQGRGGYVVMGVDLGEGTGRDSTAFVIRDDLGILHAEHSSSVGIPAAAQKIHDLSRQWGIRDEFIVFDAGGRGKDLPRYLEHYRQSAVPYHGSSGGGQRHQNRRTAVAWRLRQRLDPERPLMAEPEPEMPESLWEAPRQVSKQLQPPFSLPAERPWWPRLSEELKALRYEVKPGGKLALEPKEEMSKRLGRSPDLCDALIMTFNRSGGF